MGIKFDIETGTVFLRNFDQGVIETLGGYIGLMNPNGEIVTMSGTSLISSSGRACSPSDCKKNYFVDVPGTSPLKVPVIFNKPFPTFEGKYLPSILITRLDATPAMERWHSVCATQYRIGVGDLASVILQNGDVVSGYEQYEQLPQAMPFDIPYTITVSARYEREAVAMLKKVLSVYKPEGRILIKDSLCAVRSYTVWNESGFSDISEINDITDRTKSYSVELRIEGELDLSEPEVNNAALEFIQRTEIK